MVGKVKELGRRERRKVNRKLQTYMEYKVNLEGIKVGCLSKKRDEERFEDTSQMPLCYPNKRKNLQVSRLRNGV